MAAVELEFRCFGGIENLTHHRQDVSLRSPAFLFSVNLGNRVVPLCRNVGT